MQVLHILLLVFIISCAVSVSLTKNLLTALVICAVVVAALTMFFRVGTIQVEGNSRYTDQEVIDATGVALLAICVFMMLGMELMNSAVERAVDKPDTTHWWSAGAAKDMAAGGVLVTAFGAVVVGICLFGNAAALNAIWTSVTATPLSTALWVLSLVLAYLFTFRLGKQEQVKTPKENKTEEK